MIVKSQLTPLARSFKTNEATVFREYLQLTFLNALYGFPESARIAFKGGTAIHLIFQAPRFSEDLDFTVEIEPTDFDPFINKVFSSLKTEGFLFKSRPALAGKRYLLSGSLPHSRFTAFINLDFSFREKVWQYQVSSLKTPLPVLFTSPIRHMSKDEIYAEKIRAIFNRQRGRDLYDLWYLCSQQAKLDRHLVQAKLDYYQQKYAPQQILNRIDSFDEKSFVQDLRPFVTLDERDKLEQRFAYIKDYLKAHLR